MWPGNSGDALPVAQEDSVEAEGSAQWATAQALIARES